MNITHFKQKETNGNKHYYFSNTRYMYFFNIVGGLHEVKLCRSQNTDTKFHLYFEIKSVFIIIYVSTTSKQ